MSKITKNSVYICQSYVEQTSGFFFPDAVYIRYVSCM